MVWPSFEDTASRVPSLEKDNLEISWLRGTMISVTTSGSAVRPVDFKGGRRSIIVMYLEVVSEEPGRDGNAVRTDCIIVVASVASMGDGDRWRRTSCVGLNKAEIPLPERPSVGVFGEAGLRERVESPKALFLAALKASPPSALTPLRTVPPTLRAVCPTSLGVAGCGRTPGLCAEWGSNPGEELMRE